MNTFDAIAWAINVSKGEPMPARMLLIVGLAQRVNSNREDGLVFPSIGQICDDTDMSRSSVKKWMRHLQDAGLVEVFETRQEHGGKGVNQYRLPVRATFHHPRKGPIDSVVGGGSKSDRGVGRNSTEGRPVDSTEGGSTARPCIELPKELPNEGIESRPADAGDELDLGLPPIPPKEITPAILADFIGEQWGKRAHATPLRGGRPTDANAEKALKLAKAYKVDGQDEIGVWKEILVHVDGSDFLQGKVPGRDGRPAFKLTLSFLLEKRNFEKTLEGRFDGKSSGDARRGSTSEATSRVLGRLRSRNRRGSGGGNPTRAIAGC